MITDILVLKENGREQIINAEDARLIEGKYFLAKRIDQIALSQLGELLNISSYDEIMKEFEIVSLIVDECIFLTFPTKLQNKIKEISNTEISKVVVKWATMEEFYGTSKELEDFLASYLNGLRDFFISNPGDAFLLFG